LQYDLKTNSTYKKYITLIMKNFKK